MTDISGGVTAPKGYTASGVAAGIKKNGNKDCALIVSETAASVAGKFTTNRMAAPPVAWNREVCETGTAKAVFINSGNANAATGEPGHKDVRTTTQWMREALDAPANQMCICSTGVIGVPLPMDKLKSGFDACVNALSVDGHTDAAQAIMTTDTVHKEIAIEAPLSTGVIRIGGMAKGSGMIAPNMATMIAIITTDAKIAPMPLADILRDAVSVSFNCMCIDNDMSTSDTVLCLANGASDTADIAPGSEDARIFANALTELCQRLAKLLVKDGEGATKFVEIVIEGAPDEDSAKTAARAIAHSHLCKTAFFGQDANWGRFACAAGYSGVPFEQSDLAIWLNDVQLIAGGVPTCYAEEDAAAVMRLPEFTVRLSLGDGPGAAVFWTSDLSHEYVTINADYRT